MPKHHFIFWDSAAEPATPSIFVGVPPTPGIGRPVPPTPGIGAAARPGAEFEQSAVLYEVTRLVEECYRHNLEAYRAADQAGESALSAIEHSLRAGNTSSRALALLRSFRP